MFKQKLTGAVLAAAIALTAAGLFADGISALAQEQPNRAAEGNTEISLSSENSQLFLPTSYEQYLELESPVDIAVCERYIAVAEGKDIYFYDYQKEAAVYSKYTHTEDISKIQFAADGQLYFSDVLQYFYKLDLSAELPASSENLTHLTTFYIQGDTLFKVLMTNNTTIYISTPLSQPQIDTNQFAHNDYKNTPLLTYDNGTFYSVVEQVVNSYTDPSGSSMYSASETFALGANISSVSSVCAVNGILYFSVNGISSNNGLYAYDLTTGEETLLFEGDGYGALTSFGGKLYAVKGNAVMEYSLEGVEKTDYEISSASDSVNRLSGAQDSVRAGNLFVTADSANRRLSIYNIAEGVRSVLPLSYVPTHAATDGEIIAASSESTVYVYAWNNRMKSYECVFSYDDGYAVSGLCCLYGKCYFVTIGFGYGVIGADAEGTYSLEGSHIRATPGQNAPAALTNDLYGNLYVVLIDGSVFKYTEENFAEKTLAQGERVETILPAGFSSVRADFEGALYCLCGNTLYQNGSPLASIDGKDFVYSKDGAAISPVSFALGFEDDAVYFNFGNFIVKTEEGTLGFPTLRTIDATGVFEEIGRVHAPEEVNYTDVEKGAVGIQVDLSTLGEETQYFPFTSYSRTAEEARGVLLAEQGPFRLVALYHDREYDIRLFRGEQCTEAEISKTERAEEKYLSSQCDLYNYPCIADARAKTLPRGTKVKVLYAVCPDGDRTQEPDLGYDFAYVEAETAAREVLRGYVPLSFLTDADPSRGESARFEIVKLKEDVSFTDENGSGKTLAAGTEVRLYTNEDGSFTARYTDENGKVFSQTLTEEMIDRGESDAFRIALIVILSVLALVIIGAYFALLPHDKKKNKS